MHFSLSEISKRSGIPLRELRYVVDHELGRFWDVDLDELPQGSARMYYAGSATLIVCAARLRNAGVRREAIHRFLWSFERVPRGGKVRSKMDFLVADLDCDPVGDFRILIADSTHIRCIYNKSDTNWLRIEEKKLTPDATFSPSVVITANLDQIRKLFV